MPWTKRDTDWANKFNAMRVKDARKTLSDYDQDARKGHRLVYKECKSCFYLRSGLAGQAFTQYTCEHCGKTAMHHNTNVPKFCPECADQLGVCIRCGATRD